MIGPTLYKLLLERDIDAIRESIERSLKVSFDDVQTTLSYRITEGLKDAYSAGIAEGYAQGVRDATEDPDAANSAIRCCTGDHDWRVFQPWRSSPATQEVCSNCGLSRPIQSAGQPEKIAPCPETGHTWIPSLMLDEWVCRECGETRPRPTTMGTESESPTPCSENGHAWAPSAGMDQWVCRECGETRKIGPHLGPLSETENL